jgi:hypothetical protein
MCVRLIENNVPAAGDVVLYGSAGALDEADAAKLKGWKEKRVYVVAFAARSPEGRSEPADALIDQGSSPGLKIDIAGQERLCPVDSVLNAANLWVWTGEFAAACTRSGKMPVFYKSVVRPNGRERNSKYTDKTFHEDFTIAPIPAGVLGQTYLSQLRLCMARIKSQEDRVTQVARWYRDATPEHTLVLTLGHLFPSNFEDARAPRYTVRAVQEQDPPLKQEDSTARLILFVGYQAAPKRLVSDAAKSGSKLAYISLGSADAPTDAGDRIIHLDPGWPIDDACVKIEKYDVPILPASGVVNAALYWALTAEASGPATTPTTRP